MQITTPNGLYFHGTAKELQDLLRNLSSYYTTISQLINLEIIKKAPYN